MIIYIERQRMGERERMREKKRRWKFKLKGEGILKEKKGKQSHKNVDRNKIRAKKVLALII